MDKGKSKLLDKSRKYNVIKSNLMIQKSKYNLSLQEQKIILRLIQMIEPEDIEFQEYSFSISDFCSFCGIQVNGKNYVDIKKTLLGLTEKKWWLEIGKKKIVTVGWVAKAMIDTENGGIISVKLDEDLKPYLLQLKEKFTRYSYYYTLAMKSKYAVRLYELLKSYENLGEKKFDLDEIKSMLMAETYDRWIDVKRFAVDVAVKEINTVSDLSVNYDLEKDGKKVARIIFSIQAKYKEMDLPAAWTEIENRLNKKQFVEPWKQAVAEVMPNE